ncbi:MAG: hypothetical protein IT362_04660 [Deltaproteobacteria bacterium]|nr:hypothetical protein [Deltaproteobacteria bacterium]
MKISFVRVSFVLLSVLFLMTGVSIAQDGEAPPESPPIEQPLVREGDFALTLSEALELGVTDNETEAVNLLNSAGIAPLNGWIADYPVTPDIVGELRASVAEAADAGKLSTGKDAALVIYQDVVEEYGLSIRVGEGQGATGWGQEPASKDLNEYYTTQGPPVVTYYAPPPAYAYMYTWVPYQFWWWNYWYPGFFVLVDFDVRMHFHERVRYRPYDRFRPRFYERARPRTHDRVRPGERARLDMDRRQGEFLSNHFRERKTNTVRRIDPTRRASAVTSGVAGGTRTEYGGTRGFVQPRLRGGTRSSAFDRFGSTRIDGAASDRGFQSRTGAGITPRSAAPRAAVPGRDITNRQRLDLDKARQERAVQGRTTQTQERVNQGRPYRGDQTKRDVRKEGFRDSRGGTFHGGGRRQR